MLSNSHQKLFNFGLIELLDGTHEAIQLLCLITGPQEEGAKSLFSNGFDTDCRITYPFRKGDYHPIEFLDRTVLATVVLDTL